jgi:hypothetical protein
MKRTITEKKIEGFETCLTIGSCNCNDHLQVQIFLHFKKRYWMSCIHCTGHVVAYMIGRCMQLHTIQLQLNVYIKNYNAILNWHENLGQYQHYIFMHHVPHWIGKKKWTHFFVVHSWINVHWQYEWGVRIIKQLDWNY